MRRSGSDIPAAELEVLGALWRLGSGTVRDVLDDLERQGRRPAYTTVLTLLGRLERRGYARSRRDKVAHVYRPLISREEVAANRLSDLAKQVGEEPVPLILKLVEAQRLSARDIRALRKLLTDLEEDAARREKR